MLSDCSITLQYQMYYFYTKHQYMTQGVDWKLNAAYTVGPQM